MLFLSSGYAADLSSSLAGWGSWAQLESGKALVKLNSQDRANPSISMSFKGGGATSLVSRSGITIQENALAVSFWCRLDSGSAAPVWITLSEADKFINDGGADTFRAPMGSLSAGEWKKIVIPISSFTYAFTKGQGGDHKMERAKIDKLSFCIHNYPEQFSFSISALEFIDAIPSESSAAVQVLPSGSRNLFSGDCSFETGINDWLYFKGTALPETDKSTAAHGKSSLLIRPASSWIFNSWYLNLLSKGESYTFSFYAKAEKDGEEISAKLITPEWREPASKKYKLSDQWKRYSFSVPPQSRNETVYAAFQGNFSCTVWLDAVQIEKGTALSEFIQPEAYSVSLGSEFPGGIIPFRKGEPFELNFSMLNNTDTDSGQVSLFLELNDMDGNKYDGIRITTELGKGELLKKKLSFLKEQKEGFYSINISLRDSSGRLLLSQESSFALVADWRARTKGNPFFGTQPGVPLDCLKAIGAETIRNTATQWQHAEPEKNKFTFREGQKASAGTYHRYGMAWLATLEIAKAPAWAKDKYGLPAEPAMIGAFIDKITDFLGESADYYEIQNEPDLDIGSHRGLAMKEAAARYSDILNFCGKKLKEKNKKVLFCVSGEGAAFAEEVFRNASSSFDIFAPHPDAGARYVGPEGTALSPEENDLKGKMLAYLDMTKRYPGKKELWIGELGWGMDIDVPLNSSYSRTYAEYLCRTFLIAMSIPELKKLIWFTSYGCLEGKRYEYGIWHNRKGLQPLPSTAAYANLSSIFADGHELKEILSDNELKVYAFKSGQSVVTTLWDSARNPDGIFSVKVPSNTVRDIRNIYGSRLAGVSFFKGGSSIFSNMLGIRSNEMMLEINSSPVFIISDELAYQILKQNILVSVKTARPVSLSVHMKDSSHLKISMKNNSDTPFKGSLSVAGHDSLSSESFSMTPHGNTSMLLPFKASQENDSLASISINADGTEIMKAEKKIPQLNAIPYIQVQNPEFLPGVLKKMKPLQELKERSFLYPQDPTVGWNGEDDLSVKYWVAWDKKNFYFAALVKDDIHVQKYKNGSIWNGDSIQIAFDTLNDAVSPSASYDVNDYEYGLARSEVRDVVWRWQCPPSRKADTEAADLILKTYKEDAGLLYVLSIPWSELSPASPEPGTVFGMNFIVNDDDGSGRNYWMGPSLGIGEGKKPVHFRKFFLEAPAP